VLSVAPVAPIISCSIFYYIFYVFLLAIPPAGTVAPSGYGAGLPARRGAIFKHACFLVRQNETLFRCSLFLLLFLQSSGTPTPSSLVLLCASMGIPDFDLVLTLWVCAVDRRRLSRFKLALLLTCNLFIITHPSVCPSHTDRQNLNYFEKKTINHSCGPYLTVETRLVPVIYLSEREKRPGAITLRAMEFVGCFLLSAKRSTNFLTCVLLWYVILSTMCLCI